MAVSWALGANLRMSDAWPKACTPRSSATCTAAGLSVSWTMMSTPWSISALAASASLPGSYQLFSQTTRIWKSGLTARAARKTALIPTTTSGIGNEAM